MYALGCGEKGGPEKLVKNLEECSWHEAKSIVMHYICDKEYEQKEKWRLGRDPDLH